MGGETSITILFFFLDYLHKPLMKNFLIKPKASYFGPILDLFLPKFGIIEFPGKKAFSQFLNIYDGAKNQKKLNSHS